MSDTAVGTLLEPTWRLKTVYAREATLSTYGRRSRGSWAERPAGLDGLDGRPKLEIRLARRLEDRGGEPPDRLGVPRHSRCFGLPAGWKTPMIRIVPGPVFSMQWTHPGGR